MLQQKSSSHNAEIPGGRGSLKTPLERNFLRGGGVQTKNLPWEGYGYFLEPHIGYCFRRHVTRNEWAAHSSKSFHVRLFSLLPSSTFFLPPPHRRKSLILRLVKYVSIYLKFLNGSASRDSVWRRPLRRLNNRNAIVNTSEVQPPMNVPINSHDSLM